MQSSKAKQPAKQKETVAPTSAVAVAQSNSMPAGQSSSKTKASIMMNIGANNKRQQTMGSRFSILEEASKAVNMDRVMSGEGNQGTRSQEGNQTVAQG